MNSTLKSAIAILIVSGISTVWGCQYRQNHAMEGAMGMLIGSTGDSTYSVAGYALGLGLLAFLIGIGCLIAGLVASKK